MLLDMIVRPYGGQFGRVEVPVSHLLFVARRCFGAEPDGDPAVRVHPNTGKRAIEPCKLLIRRKQRTSVVVIDREGPEVFRGDRSWKGHLLNTCEGPPAHLVDLR